jgi:hypothetical protein
MTVCASRHESVVWSVVVGVERGEVLKLWLDRLLAGSSRVPAFVDKLTFRLQQTQLAGTRDRFGAPLDL